ncbi:hypothetical protein NEPAR06_1887 [Nematocida parisii]|nr:hypothetical protein NEPAR06_1887 [Nematocida parisii]KAI5157793.1 hypothetical protein NEPAR05_1595 [Nematocida parisii]
MGEYIDEELRIELQKEFSDKKGEIEDGDMQKIYKIITDNNRTTKIFKDLPEPLTNLAYNIFYAQIYSRNINRDYKEDTAISAINDSITQTYEIIDMIEEEANTLNSKSKKEAFYKLISNNHSIMAQVYMNRKNFYDSFINILREKAGISELDEEITSKDAIVKLCELTELKKCSRLQNALNILMKHDDNLTITDENGEEQSNICDLELTNDDIYSLQLLARTKDSDFFNFTHYIINNLIYNSICIQDKDKRLYTSIGWLYYTIYNMSIIPTTNDIFSLDKDKNKNTIKTHLNQLKNMKSIVFRDTKYTPMLLDKCKVVLGHKDFNIDKIRNNVLQSYFKSIKSDICDIIGRPIEETTIKGLCSKTIIIVVIFMVVMLIVFSIIFLYLNEAKKIMNNLNII